MGTAGINLVVVLICVSGLARPDSSSPRATAEQERHFVKRVLSVLQAKCFACHGQDPDKIKGGLNLTTRAGLLTGGDSGQAALTPGKPDDSPLWHSVNRESAEWSAMPPKDSDQLTAEQRTALKKWIADQAPWPSQQRIAELQQEIAEETPETKRISTSGGITEGWTNRPYKRDDVWAFQPLATEPFPEGSIDRLINQKLQTLRLKPAPRADRRTLLRRVTFGLTGLPPTPAEIEAFLADPDPDRVAYARVVDRLLASPHYGERMAQHWLDVVRYADSSGFANDYERGNAWRYRDYVVRSFNADKPYNQFVREQIAGDELAPQDPEALIAVGFLRMGPWELTGMEVPKVSRQRFLDDVTDTVGQAFLAQPLQCARCHDHKFDPIPTRDYYGIQAVFATLQIAERPVPFLPSENRAGFGEKQYLEARREYYTEELKHLNTAEAKARAEWEKSNPLVPGQKPSREKYLAPEHLGRERIARKELERLAWRLDRYEPIAHSVYSGHTPDLRSVYRPLRMPKDPLQGELEATAILTGGDPFSPAEAVMPGVLSAINGGKPGTIPQSVQGRRSAFAQWLTAPDNPLTARVMANRIWAWHFGTALAGNPNNFGTTGKKPTHPELLDGLARELIRHNGSIKALQRQILLSDAYCRSSRHPDMAALKETDPLGQSYAVYRSRRLSAEELRDAILASTGELNLQVGGIPSRPEMNLEVAAQPRQVMGTFAESWQPNPRPEDRHRRSLYILKLRGLRDPYFEVFNQPAPDAPCEQRESSTVAPQAFTLFNSEMSYRRAITLAARVHAKATTQQGAIRELFIRTLGREPKTSELRLCLEHWQAMVTRHEAIQFARPPIVHKLDRSAVEENTGESFRYVEPLEMAKDFIPDLHPSDCKPVVRGLAEVALVLLNSNEFITVE